MRRIGKVECRDAVQELDHLYVKYSQSAGVLVAARRSGAVQHAVFQGCQGPPVPCLDCNLTRSYRLSLGEKDKKWVCGRLRFQ